MEWFQDGTKLLVSGPVAQEKQGIWLISVIGATLKKLRDDAHDASLSRDGSQIVFRDAITQDVWVMSADGGQARILFRPDAGYHLFRPTWFPNGKRILYGKYRSANGESSVVLESRDSKGGDPVPLLSNLRLTDFCWRTDGGRLIYSVREPIPNQYDSNLWELRFDEETGKPKGTPRRLTDWTGFFFGYPELTADGNRLVFLNGKGQSDVYVGELTNGGSELKTPQRLTLDERADWPGGWSLDSKTIFLYSDRLGTFDIYKQGLGERNAEPVATGPDEKWAPQASPDGKWVLYMQWPKTVEGSAIRSGKLMRAPISGGPAEAVMDIKGYPAVTSGDPTNTAGGYPSFRCPLHGGSTCVLAEAGENQLVFTAFDPLQGRKGELARIPSDPDRTSWDVSPEGGRVVLAVFDYKAGDLQIVPLAGGTPQKLSAMPWTELVAVAWVADGKSLFLASYSSRGTSIVRTGLTGESKLLFKQPSWDIFSLAPSPDGHFLAFGPVITSANAWTIASFPRK